MPNGSDPLQELRDVHMPDPISWWPPAFGWWMILIVLAMVVALVLWAKAHYERTRFRRVALAQLKQVKQEYDVKANEQWAITEISHLLRRYTLSIFTRSEVAGLSGQAWLQFLDQTGGTTQFTNGPGQVLCSGPYQLQGIASVADLLPLVERWIQHVQIPPARKPVA